MGMVYITYIDPVKSPIHVGKYTFIHWILWGKSPINPKQPVVFFNTLPKFNIAPEK